MSNLNGVQTARKKNGTLYYRSSITYINKHISLGSFNEEENAHEAYLKAKELLTSDLTVKDYKADCILPFEKYVILINYRDYKLYIKTPIYMHKYYFSYYISPDIELKFDVDDLFFYSHHKIFKKGNYLFVNDYGMQINILERYGIKKYAVLNRDYRFIDGDRYNFRYHNIHIINPYFGVEEKVIKGTIKYVTKIHINGDFVIGKYSDITKAAIAYNKIADYLNDHHITDIDYQRNYIEKIDAISYSALYHKIRIPKNILELGNYTSS